MIFMFLISITLSYYYKSNRSRNKKQITAAENHRCLFAFHCRSMKPFLQHTAKSMHTQMPLYLHKSILQQILKIPPMKEYKS